MPRPERGPRPPEPPAFLGRTSYRQRRLRDALRLLPVLGAILLVLLPLTWPRGEGMPTSTALLYLFGAWLLLAGLARLLSALMRPDAIAEVPSPPDDPKDDL